jgi:hypothetical protein
MSLIKRSTSGTQYNYLHGVVIPPTKSKYCGTLLNVVEPRCMTDCILSQILDRKASISLRLDRSVYQIEQTHGSIQVVLGIYRLV